MNEHDRSRRDFLKKGAYAAPVILSLTAMPSFAQTGSGRPTRHKKSHGKKKKHHKHGPH